MGVSDDGAFLGLEADMQTLKKKDVDGLELFLTDLLLSQRLSLSGLVRVSFHTVSIKGSGHSVKGTYVSVETEHLTRYVDEQAFKFNNCKSKDADRFQKVVSGVSGQKVTYKKLIENKTSGGG